MIKMEATYKNPPIKEAIFEVRFNSRCTINESISKEIHKNIIKVFKNKKKRHGGSIEIKFDEKGIKTRNNKLLEEAGYEYLSDDEKDLFILSPDKISIHRIKSYNGWAEFGKNIELVLKSIYKNIKDIQSSRLGLRYINELKIPKHNFKIEELFNFRPYYLTNHSEKITSFMIGIVKEYNGSNGSTKIQLIQNSENDDNYYKFLFDIDHFSADKLDSKQKIIDWKNEAHNKILTIFETSLSEEIKLNFNK